MKKLMLPLLLSLAVLPAFAQLSEKEQALITECEANVDPAKKALSPVVAEKCVKGFNEGTPETLITRYSAADPSAAGKVLGYNNALLDLRKIVMTQKGIPAAEALARVLEKPSCALCDMKLGPRPEAAFDWVKDYAGDAKLQDMRKSVRTWDALGEIRTKSLSSPEYSRNKDNWNSIEIIGRYLELSGWAKKETDNLDASSRSMWSSIKRKLPFFKSDFIALKAVLKEDLEAVGDTASVAKLETISEKMAAAGAGKDPEKPSAADKRSKDLAAAGKNIAAQGGRSLQGQNEYLGQTFDNTGAAKPGNYGQETSAAVKLGDDRPAPAQPVRMTAAQETELAAQLLRMEDGKTKGYLADVMDQTEAGKRTNAFYSDPQYAKAGTNRLDFGFTREPGVFGYWNSSAKVLRINTEVAEEFAAKRGMTVDALMKDKDAMKDLALYISPVMVHESEHQNQTARAIAQGIDYKKFDVGSNSPTTRGKENLSNKWSSEHMIEYCAKNGGAACFGKFSEMHADNADKFMQGGVEALDTLKAPLYARLDSFEGGAAREFKQVKAYAARLKTLEDMQRANPEGMTPEQKQELKDYREMMDTRFKWYTITYRENQDAEKEALAFRKKYASKSLGLTMPAEF